MHTNLERMNGLSWVPILTIPLIIIYHLNVRNKIRNLENIIEKQKKKLSNRRSQPVLKVSLLLETKTKAKLHEHNIIDSVRTEIKDKIDIEISMYNEILGIKNV